MSELFLEIRCEELPARFVVPAIEALARGLQDLIKGVPSGAVSTWATPRRLAVAIADVAPARASESRLVTGPPVASASKDGRPGPAAEGFARKFGVDASALEVVDTPKGQVYALRQQVGGESTVGLVAAGLEALILGVPFAKSMRWGSGKIRWGRPFHGIVLTYGGALIPAQVAHLQTTTVTFGHRLYADPIHVTDSLSWLHGLAAGRVEPDRAVRRARILGDLTEKAAELGATVPDMPDLVDEVVNLVEWPVVVVGEISPELMHLPPRLLVESMKVHQRVFPLFRAGTLDNHYLIVTNHPLATDPDVAAVISTGNTRVLAARFHDARHFYATDKQTRLEARWPNLQGMGWIRKGGTMADKAERLVHLAGDLAPHFGADPDLTRRAARLCKCDLATLMVGEFPELQGHVGRLLAAHQGEVDAVSLAIEEHYLPRNADDSLPTAPTGQVLALADRLDTLAGCYVLDQKPKGSADPLGLRRAANGLLSILRAVGRRARLDDLFGHAIRVHDPAGLAAHGRVEIRDELVQFTLARLRAQLQEQAATEYVDAVLASGDTDPVAIAGRLSALVALSKTDGFGALKTTFKRVLGLTREHGSSDFEGLTEPAEIALADALAGARLVADTCAASLDYAGALAALAELKAPVDTLFDQVLVMHDDQQLRARRLGLLRAVADAFRQVADFTHLSA